MTVRAHEIAFRGFFDEPSETSAELSEAKFLCGWISVMELQRFRADGVATIDASSSVRCDQIEFSLLTPLSQRTTELLTPPVPARSRGLLCGSESQRNLRSVVVAERRALEAETAPVERAHLPVDDHLGRKFTAASDAHECFRGTHDWFARLLERHEWTASEAVFAAPKIASSAIDDGLNWEILSATHADKHEGDRT